MINKAKPRLHHAGITLIELMLVLAVVAILTGVAAPTFDGIAASQRMSGVVNTYVASFQQARLRALTRAGSTVLCPSADGRTCSRGLAWQQGWLSYDDENHNRRLDPGETVSARYQALPVGYTATSSVSRPQLRYQSDGSAAGSNLTLIVCSRERPGQGRAIAVNNGGRPRVTPAPPSC